MIHDSLLEGYVHGSWTVHGDTHAQTAGGGGSEGDDLAGEGESDPTVPFGDPVGNFHLQMYAAPPPPPGYKAPPSALRGAPRCLTALHTRPLPSSGEISNPSSSFPCWTVIGG